MQVHYLGKLKKKGKVPESNSRATNQIKMISNDLIHLKFFLFFFMKLQKSKVYYLGGQGEGGSKQR